MSKNLTLKIDASPKATLYLSISWQPDAGKDFGYKLVKQLDERRVLMVGDPKGFGDMDPARLRRVMDGCDGCVCVLPYRPEKPTLTSSYMIDELKTAVEFGLPVAVFCDKRIGVKQEESNCETVYKFVDGTTVSVPQALQKLVVAYDYGVERSESIKLIELADFIDGLNRTAGKVPKYGFLITRLQPDFSLPRKACVAAVAQSTGLPCLWIDAPNYTTNIDDTIERVKLLIKHSEFVVAEMSLTAENPDFDNPSRAHEIGLATAFGKDVIPVSHDPRRHPYHGIVSAHVVWWQDESELFDNLTKRLHSTRGTIGRHVYNWDLPYGESSLPPDQFLYDAANSWQPPSSLQLPSHLSWIFACSFSVIVFCLALLLRKFVGYDDTLDLAAILAAVTTFLFSSRISHAIHRQLCSLIFLRWLIPLIAAIIFGATIVVFKPNPESTNDKSMHTESPTAPVDYGTITPAAR
ncbi:MAG: hypothetical protein LW720_10905 [Pirellula sp.]|jgi:hypothetical protein|nr:hypothetical protein [Pirellula sp.]